MLKHKYNIFFNSFYVPTFILGITDGYKYKRCAHTWLLSLHFSPDSLRISGLATVTAAVKSLPLYSVSNCHVTNCDCCVYKDIENVTPSVLRRQQHSFFVI